MLKFLFFSFTLLLSFDTYAVRQSLSKALSYKNIVKDTRVAKPNKNTYRGAIDQNRMEHPVILPPKNETVDMTISAIETVALKKNDTVEITLKEESGYFWKMSPPSDLSIQTNDVKDNLRVVKYKMLSNNAPLYMYFDYINAADNKIEESKQLTINLRD